MSKKVTTYTDGGARGNPGPAGIGAVVHDLETDIVHEHKKYIGETTNNQAEYKALIMALESAKELSADEVQCFLDSELVVKQMRKEYKVKDPGLQKLFIQAYNLTTAFKKVTFSHIPREKNKHADRLVNEAIDEHVS
ncbi:MAG: ribonuclease HI family protein [bacterium]|nr:ribonuclease HI family protein [bacterium]